MNSYSVHEKFVTWLGEHMTCVGRGDQDTSIRVKPSGKFWLGRIQSEQAVKNSDWGDKGERLEPCAFGVKIKPKSDGVGVWNVSLHTEFRVWLKSKGQDQWKKSDLIRLKSDLSLSAEVGKSRYLETELQAAIESVISLAGLSAAIEVDIERGFQSDLDLTVTLVNTSPESCNNLSDTRFYECKMSLITSETLPYKLSALEDSFRYDRTVPAYGINCGVVSNTEGCFTTEDVVTVEKNRPKYWNVDSEEPILEFRTLAEEPLKPSRSLLDALLIWGEESWSISILNSRKQKENWSEESYKGAIEASSLFEEECERIKQGIELLESNNKLKKAFMFMNEAMALNSKYNGYSSWRCFQFGFLLANLSSLVNEDESNIADVVWFATGGGKTETYLGLLITAAYYDRLTGKTSGVTAWSRFPLRMLSLQQTQRFANAIAAADIVRKKYDIKGARFSLGFLVGNGATPNKVPVDAKAGEPDVDDRDMPSKYKILDTCPYCHNETIKMGFDRKSWRLFHSCTNSACITKGSPLPIYVVDEEIYRFLPTVVVGTLDKAASISMQTAMRGLIGAPKGKCSKGHGYTYAARKSRPNGCLVPGCKGDVVGLGMESSRFGPSFRLQDELHLLRDSLGAVDAHYEAIFDYLEKELCGRTPKILASSATLTGYQKQVEVLYRRKGRVFPVPPPKDGEGFWTADSEEKMRNYIAVAPKGVTIEYTVDRLLAELQKVIRRINDAPQAMSKEIGIPVEHMDEIVSLYGTNVVYGNTIRDLEAVTRSAETQLSEVSGKVNVASLTGKTEFQEVVQTLKRLESPEMDFSERVHLIAASSMMSHGVDINRLNTMVMLGIPLSAAEFIQATARVGRKYPSLVFVVHKIGRERDAGIFRSFSQFVTQGDRFVDPIPISKRSRQVLSRTISGLVLARLRMIHEYESDVALTTVKTLREYYQTGRFNCREETEKLFKTLNILGDLDSHVRSDIKEWMEEFEANIKEPPNTAQFPDELSPSDRPPMRSLRDVEKQVPIRAYVMKNSWRKG